MAPHAMLHELWEYVEDGHTCWTFCHTGPRGDGARAILPGDAKLVWTVEAASHFEAMTRYYERQGWGQYTTEYAEDYQPYPDEWITEQRAFLERDLS
jgi:hypothetical protein